MSRGARLFSQVMPSLEQLRFDNTYARLPPGFSVRVSPRPLEDARLVSVSPGTLRLLELEPSEARRPEFVEALGGKRPLPGMEPVATVYAGHQFGMYVPRLGDGRALLLGEVRTSSGERWELQLKGSGVTPFSRMGDGRAVLRSTIREYLRSEAMHALGIPTTRALCIIGGNEKVYREEVETGAMLIRVAPSHVRFGTFEYFHHTEQSEHVATLADYVIARHFPHLEGAKDRHARFYAEVVERTARLVAQWQAVSRAPRKGTSARWIGCSRCSPVPSRRSPSTKPWRPLPLPGASTWPSAVAPECPPSGQAEVPGESSERCLDPRPCRAHLSPGGSRERKPCCP